MSVDPLDVEREQGIIEMEREFLRKIVSSQARAWVDFAEDASDHTLSRSLRDLIHLCDNEPSDDRICEVASTDAGVGWCRNCGAEAEHVAPDGKGDRCKSCSALAVDGVEVWLFERTGMTRKWEETLNELKAAQQAAVEKGDNLPRDHPACSRLDAARPRGRAAVPMRRRAAPSGYTAGGGRSAVPSPARRRPATRRETHNRGGLGVGDGR